MGTSAVRRGAVGEQVQRNVQALREQRRLTLRELAERLSELGHPLQASALAKIEGGSRRVDVDDLLALAAALNVPPNRLLLPDTSDDSLYPVAPRLQATTQDAWDWANGEFYLFAAEDADAVVDEKRAVAYETLRAPTARLSLENDAAIRATRNLELRLKRLVEWSRRPASHRQGTDTRSIDGVKRALTVAQTEVEQLTAEVAGS